MAWKTRSFRGKKMKHTRGEVASYYAGLRAGRASRFRGRRTRRF